MATKSIVHYELAGRDTGALRRVYSILFGCQVHPTGVYYEVTDVQDSLSLAEELGGTVLTPNYGRLEGPVRVAFVADPEGHVVCVSQGAPQAPCGQPDETWAIVQRMIDETKRQQAAYRASLSQS
jgi:hypothetical protein